MGTSNAVQGIERLVNDVTVYAPTSQNQPLTRDLTDLRFLGAGVTVTELATDEITITIAGSTDDQTATEVPVAATGFDGNLTTSATTVQAALQEIDDLAIGGGGGSGPTQIATASITARLSPQSNNLIQRDRRHAPGRQIGDRVRVMQWCGSGFQLHVRVRVHHGPE